MTRKPYVVSADIYLLLDKWAKQKNFVLPKKEFFEKLRREFSNYMLQIFPNFEFISEEEILKHMQSITSNTNLPCVSLDQVYSNCNFSIELTRTVDLHGKDIGLRHRFGSCSLSKQLNQLKWHGIKDVCLVDDFIFSGVLMERVIKLLSQIDIRVSLVCAGIGIKEGINRIGSKYREIHCARVYNEVIDGVCERDTYLGIPFSGRSVVSKENVGLSYFLPYGKPDTWASIPVELQEPFSKFCIKQTIKLFEEIEETSNRIVCCSDIERKVPRQPETGNYIEFLKSITLKQLSYV